MSKFVHSGDLKVHVSTEALEDARHAKSVTAVLVGLVALTLAGCGATLYIQDQDLQPDLGMCLAPGPDNASFSKVGLGQGIPTCGADDAPSHDVTLSGTDDPLETQMRSMRTGS